MESIEYPDYTKFFPKQPNCPINTLEFIWLGQAGFAFRYNNITLIIDPYLSDYLSKKYIDGIFPHNRLMDIPISPDKIHNLDVLLSTHPHSDHMDPETIPALLKWNPHVRIIVPSPAIGEAIIRGAPQKNIIIAKSEQIIGINENIKIVPVPAAHEELKTDENGENLYLGYIFKFGDLILYHSGDCVPYDGLIDFLVKYKVNIAFLPINGRDDYRRSNNIAGNFHISEVLDICKKVNISQLVVHHFGMFAYNTVTSAQLRNLREQSSNELNITIPEMFSKYKI